MAEGEYEIMVEKIVVNTETLNSYATRIQNVINRLGTLNSRIRNLYYTGKVTGIYSFVSSNRFYSGISTLNSCKSYLTKTASDFETVENYFANVDPLNFVQPSRSLLSLANSSDEKGVDGNNLNSTETGSSINRIGSDDGEGILDQLFNLIKENKDDISSNDDAIIATNEVEETTIDEKSPEELVNRMLELAKALLKVDDGDTEKDIGGLAASLLSYLKKLAELIDGDAENGLVLSSEALELASGSVDLWDKLAELLKYFYELKDIPGVEEVGLVGELCALIASILEAAGKDYDSVGEQIGEAIKKIGGSITDLGAVIYKLLEKGATAAVSIYAGIAKAILASYGQFIESLEEYAKDGSFDLGDVADTGVDVAIEGLAALISTATLGIISENTTGMTAEEVREKLKESADQLGKDAAEYIMNNPKLREMYNNGNGAERAMLIAYAVAMVQYGPTPGLPGKNYTGDPDDIAVQIAIDKSKHIPGEYQWAP